MLLELTQAEYDAVMAARLRAAKDIAIRARSKATREQWQRDADAGFPVYPGGRTREQWAPIAAQSAKSAAGLPED